MKKRLLLLPIFASLTLTGCEITLFGKTIKLFEPSSTDSLDLPANFKQEIDGYKMATSLKDGGEYILGVYRVNEDVMRFADGNYHSDDNGQYSFYLGTSTDISEAAIVKAKSLGDGEFSLQMIAKGKVWHNKYIAVYNAKSSYGNDVMSIAALDELDQTTFTTINRKTTTTVTAVTQTHFKYYETYEDMPAYSVGAMYEHEGIDLSGPVPKFIGTGHNTNEDEADYISMDCKTYEVALELSSYDLAHLYEKK